MRNKLNLFGIIVILAAIGLSTIACSKDDDEETYYVRYADLTLMRYNDAATTVTISGTTPENLINNVSYEQGKTVDG